MFIGHLTKDAADISERKGSYLVLYFSQRNHEERYETRAGRQDVIASDVFIMNGERKVPRRCMT